VKDNGKKNCYMTLCILTFFLVVACVAHGHVRVCILTFCLVVACVAHDHVRLPEPNLVPEIRAWGN